MSPRSLSIAHALLLLIPGISLALAGPPRHNHVIRDIPSALTSTQTEDETTYYTEATRTYTSLPPFWPPRPTPRSSSTESTSSDTTWSPEYPDNTPTDTTTTTSWTWNFTLPWNTTFTGYPQPTGASSIAATITHFTGTGFTTNTPPYCTWAACNYSDTWGDHNTYPPPSSASPGEGQTTTTISVIKTLTSFTTTVIKSSIVHPHSSPSAPTFGYLNITSSKSKSSSSFTFKTTPFANLTTFTSPRWTTLPIASLTGSNPFCVNAADPQNGIGNHCVCQNGETVGVIPWTTQTKGGGNANVSDYQPCAYTTVG